MITIINLLRSLIPCLGILFHTHLPAAPKPNIVLIYIDDMGYGDIGSFGNKVNQTPHLDRMAKEGNVLRQFYVANTACTPSRAALLTGTYAHRIGMDGTVCFPGENRGLNPKETTIAEMLKEVGYTTGCFGKWHLGDQKPFLPLAQGFDKYFGIPYSNDMWPGNKRGNPITNRGPYEPLPIIRGNEAVAYVADGADQSLLAEVVTDEAVKFIQVNKDNPFFCYVPHAYVHLPRFARPDILKKAGGNVARSNVEEVDTSVGRILDTLAELGIAENTLVLFTSDNGGAGGMSMGPLRGSKGGPKYEGHMRVPTVAWWPGTIPPGTETNAIGVTTDLLPSFAKLTGAKVPNGRKIDGKDYSDALLGKPDAKSPHELHYYEVEGIRQGDWKLVKGRKGLELYDLSSDLGESKNLAGDKPELAKELNGLLEAHAKSIARDTRPAGFVEDAKPILKEPGKLPKLRELMGMPDLKVKGPLYQKTPNRPKPPTQQRTSNQRPKRMFITPAEYKPDPQDILIADFEGKDYGDWEVVGKAMGNKPARQGTHRNRISGVLGKGFVNTYLNGDKTTGELISQPFKIKRRFINFLIGGGNHPDKAGIQLRVDDKTVRFATGRSLKNPKNEEVLDWQSLNVEPFLGKEAVIKIVDKHSGGWGHTVVDHIFLSDKPMPSSIPKNLKVAQAHKPQKSELFASSATATRKPGTQPNVVLIFIDDMGYGDIGPFGSDHPTPHLDRMAAEGMKLTNFYVSSTACTPSRSALLTGCYADRIGMGRSVVFPADPRGLHPDEITIAEILKEAGYATGCFGKWHLGDQPQFMPLAQGFDAYEGIPYSNDMWVKGNPKRKYPPLPWIKQNQPVAHIPDQASQNRITDAITDATVNFIHANKDRPFFAYIPHSAVHAPHTVTPDRLKAAGDNVMRALIAEIDDSTGRILQTLRELGIDQNTLVLFTNDNGGAGKTSSGPLRGHKFGPKYEGHMRVATLARWPGKIPANTVSNEILATIDVLPTLAKLSGQPVPKDRIIDGHDISPILLGQPGAKSPHQTLYYEKDGIREGHWKLVHYRIKADRFNELYNLENDLGEQNNLAAQYPEKVKALKAKLDAHVENLEAHTRPAGNVENPKPLLLNPKGVPTLVEYLNQRDNH